MAKHADYYITKQRMSSDGKHLSTVLIRPYLQDRKLGPTEEWPRNTVINALQNNKSFKTTERGTDGKLHVGSPVRIVTVDSSEYIRCDEGTIPSDGLGNVTRF